MSINDRLDRHIETNYNEHDAQTEAIRSHFSQAKHKDFLRKIRDHQDFFACKSNDTYRIVVNRNRVFIEERLVIEDEIPVGRIFPFNHLWRPRVQKFWPDKSNISVLLDDEDHVEVIVNEVIKSLDEALKFLDFALFE